jgi:glc operon protein GlcG
MFHRWSLQAAALLGLAVLLSMSRLGVAQSPQSASSLISLANARIIIEASVAYARERKLRMAVVVIDQSAHIVSSDRMDGASFHLNTFAEGKAFAALILRQPTERASTLAKDRPDRYFGILGMYPGKVYLVGGGVPLVVGNTIVGAVGIAGLPKGVDEKAALAGIAAWNKAPKGPRK